MSQNNKRLKNKPIDLYHDLPVFHIRAKDAKNIDFYRGGPKVDLYLPKQESILASIDFTLREKNKKKEGILLAPHKIVETWLSSSYHWEKHFEDQRQMYSYLITCFYVHIFNNHVDFFQSYASIINFDKNFEFKIKYSVQFITGLLETLNQKTKTIRVRPQMKFSGAPFKGESNTFRIVAVDEEQLKSTHTKVSIPARPGEPSEVYIPREPPSVDQRTKSDRKLLKKGQLKISALQEQEANSPEYDLVNLAQTFSHFERIRNRVNWF